MNTYVMRAVSVEFRKLRRSPLILVCSLIVILAPLLLGVGATFALRGGSNGTLAQKVTILVHGTGWEALIGIAAEVSSVGSFLAFGFGFAWAFGREFADSTIVNLFSLPTRRGEIALAKLTVLLLWSIVVSVLSAVLVVLAGLALGPMAGDPGRLGLVPAVSLLSACNAAPLAWVATVRRGYLAAIGVLLGLVVATQLFVALGGGGWFPWAVPGLWSGFGGAEVRVNLLQLLSPAVVLAIAFWATVRTWNSLRLGE